jgi:hypothetical protein
MTYVDRLRQRLFNQHVSGNPLPSAENVVRWLGAVQAQDYGAAKWALAQRMTGATDAAIDEAFAAGAILRTHLMRPTWHFVTPADIRWMLKLTAPRVNAVSAYYFRKWGVDDRVFARSRAVLVKALRGGRHLTRAALASALTRAGILGRGDDPMRLGGLMMRAELDAVICSGPRQGKQFTYALLDERVPAVPDISHEQAREELARRYFTSHGPATLQDFMWWSGVSAVDARAGLESIASTLSHETNGGRTYWHSTARRKARVKRETAYLIPVYDESLLSYRDSRGVYAAYGPQVTRDNGQMIIVDGAWVGTWKRTIKKSEVVVNAHPFEKPTRARKDAIAAAADRYGRFLGLDAAVAFDK